jgi:hypothetical protein
VELLNLLEHQNIMVHTAAGSNYMYDNDEMFRQNHGVLLVVVDGTGVEGHCFAVDCLADSLTIPPAQVGQVVLTKVNSQVL